jgi:HSP20 family protein
MYQFELKPFRNEWDKEIEKFFGGFNKPEYFAPACEVRDEEGFYSISMDIPGLGKDDLSVEIKDNQLHISGERKSRPVLENGKVVRTERKYGKFVRVFSVPQDVNAEGIEARFEHGVLDLKLPKEQRAQSKKINISGWTEQDVETNLKS